MNKAEKLVKSGATAADAARKTGLSTTAIYQSAWYRALKNLPPKLKKGEEK